MKSTKSGIPGVSIRTVGNPVPTLPVAVPVSMPLSAPGMVPGEMLDVLTLTNVPVDAEGVTPQTEVK